MKKKKKSRMDKGLSSAQVSSEGAGIFVPSMASVCASPCERGMLKGLPTSTACGGIAEYTILAASTACQESRLGTNSGRGYYAPNVRVDGLLWNDVLSILTSPTGLHLQG